MLKRKQWILIHIILAGLFLPFFFVLPLSGSLILLDEEGSVTKTFDFKIQSEFTNNENQIRKILNDQGRNFDFEYIRTRGNKMVLRPATRMHYEVESEEGFLKFYKVEPSFLRILKELHFGHGPQILRTLQMVFGFAFTLVTISGLVLMFGLKKMLPLFFASVGIGALLFFALLFI